MSDLPPEALQDHFKPPSIPIEVHCLHCGEEYESYLIEWVANEKRESETDIAGFWCCPTPNCGGKGFCFDIFPTDPEYVDENTGEKIWHEDDGHDDDCDCLECEQFDAEMEAEMAEYKRRKEAGEIPETPSQLLSDSEDDIPF